MGLIAVVTMTYAAPRLALLVQSQVDMKSIRGLVVVMSFVSAVMVGAMASAAPPRIGDQAPLPLGAVAQGTIAWASANGEWLVLKGGTHLIVPESVNIPRAKLTAPHSVKAYYDRTDRGNVVRLIEVQALHPGSGGGIEGKATQR